MNTKGHPKFLIFLLCLSMTIWGVAWSSAKVLAGYGSSSHIAWIRFVFVFTSLGILLPLLKLPIRIPKKGWGITFGAFASMTGYSLLFFYAMQIGNSGAGGVLVTTTIPVLSYGIGWLLHRKTLPKKDYLGLTLGFLSLFFLQHLWAPDEGFFDLPSALLLICSLLWAIMTKFSSKANLFTHPLTFNFWIHTLTVLCLGLFLDHQETLRILKEGDALFWGNLLFFGIINSTGATTIYLYATTKLGAERATSFIYLVPLGALLSSWVFLGETPLWYTIVGGVIGVMAAMQLQRKA